MKAILLIISCGFLFFTFIAPVSGEENRGAETISIFAGEKGNITFPHRKHQNRLTNCMPCHELFPKTSGSIKSLKSEEKLSSKQVMNTLCINCHRAKREAGEPAGPVACTACHMK